MASFKINHMSFGYGSDRKVLHDIDIEIDDGGLVCIIGPNGVGKSTLVRCLNGLLKPTEGGIELDGKDLNDYTIQELSEIIGFVPATTTITFPMSVVDSILIGLNAKNKWRVSNEDISKVYKTLNLMRMRELALRSCNELSAGQVQKVALCRGIVRASRILILDEPTANLDIKHQIFVSDFMHELAKATGSLIIMISHDLNIAARYADKIIVMSKPGKIYSYGTPQETITEQMISDVYDVSSDIIVRDGRPFVFLKNALNW